MSDSKNTRETNNPENPNEDEDLIEEFGKEEFEDDYEDEDEDEDESKKSIVSKNFQNHFRIIFDLRYFMITINVIALKFPSILWPAIKSMTAIGKRTRLNG